MRWIHSHILRQIVLSPFLLAIPFTLLILILIPDFFPRFKSDLIETGFINKPGGYEFWRDVDMDGKSELIVLFNNTEGEASLKVIEEDGLIGAHYYCRGEMLSDEPHIYFVDFDHSGNNRIIVFSLSNDSIFLNCIDHANLHDFLFRNLFIGKIRTAGSKDAKTSSVFFEDMDGDGWKEIILTIIAGFPLQPRGCFIYDVRHNQLNKSPDMGVFMGNAAIEDINQDGFKEIFTTTYSISNYPDSSGGFQDDHSAWIMAFNKDLQFLFPPVEFRGEYIIVATLPVRIGNEWKLVSLLYQLSSGNTVPKLILSTIEGKVISERELGDSSERLLMDLFYVGQEREFIYKSDQQGNIEKIDGNLQTIEKFNVPVFISNNFLEADLDEDGKKELICAKSYGYPPVIFRHDFSSPVYLDLPPSMGAKLVQIKTLENGKNTIAIQQSDHFYHYSYERNRFYFMKFPFYIGIYLFILGFIFLIRRLQRVQFERNRKISDKITTLQLKSIKSQFDPHLTFNILTSISYAVHQENKELTNQFIAKFSAFIRGIVTDSDKISRTLGTELLLISNYLDVEKMRLPQFSYDISTPENLDLSIEIPKNIVLTFVENAMKHGIRPKEGPARIIVWVEEKTGGPLKIYIEDDGVGRTAPKDIGTENTGKGLLIVEQILDLWDKLTGKRITWAIEDLIENNKPTGTRVRITIP